MNFTIFSSVKNSLSWILSLTPQRHSVREKFCVTVAKIQIVSILDLAVS